MGHPNIGVLDNTHLVMEIPTPTIHHDKHALLATLNPSPRLSRRNVFGIRALGDGMMVASRHLVTADGEALALEEIGAGLLHEQEEDQ